MFEKFKSMNPTTTTAAKVDSENENTDEENLPEE